MLWLKTNSTRSHVARLLMKKKLVATNISNRKSKVSIGSSHFHLHGRGLCLKTEV